MSNNSACAGTLARPSPQAAEAAAMSDAVRRQLQAVEEGGGVHVIDVCGEDVGMGGGDAVAAAAPSPPPFVPQLLQQQRHAPPDIHLSVPRLIDAFLPPPPPLPPLPLLPQRTLTRR